MMRERSRAQGPLLYFSLLNTSMERAILTYTWFCDSLCAPSVMREALTLLFRRHLLPHECLPTPRKKKPPPIHPKLLLAFQPLPSAPLGASTYHAARGFQACSCRIPKEDIMHFLLPESTRGPACALLSNPALPVVQSDGVVHILNGTTNDEN